MPGKEVRNYEAMVILNAQMGDEDINAMVQRLEGILNGGGATIREIARWGRRRLAYEIARKKDGYYVIFYFNMTGKSRDTLDNFEKACRFDENVLRHMVITVPVKKRDREVAQLVPQPGYLADFRFEPRGGGMRRRYEDRPAPAPAAPVEAAPAEAAPSEAAPSEAAPAEPAPEKPAE
ncbi:30S ribosomal protein S6 [bacterium]|nr:30S ribosomal protein S6 [bacterium]